MSISKAIQIELDNGSKVDIHKSSRRHTELLNEAIRDEATGDFFLDVQVWTCGDSKRVEFLITCGGPSVSVHVDEFDHVTFLHSWGIHPHNGSDLDSIRMHPDDVGVWIEMAECRRDM